MDADNSPSPSPPCASIGRAGLRIAIRRWLRVLWICRASALSVAVGVILAFRPQVHDLFLDVATPGQEAKEGAAKGAALLGFYLTVFWALPVHAVARLAVSDPWWVDSPYAPSDPSRRRAAAELFAAPAAWIPRLLGVGCYIVAIGAAFYAWSDMPIAHDEPLARQVGGAIRADLEVLAGFGLLFATYAFCRRRLAHALLPGRAGPVRPRINVMERSKGWGGWLDEAVAFLGVAALVYQLTQPVFDWTFVRLWLLPMLLGAWTPVIGLLSRAGYRWRAPLEILAVAALVAGFFAFGDNHKSATESAAAKRPTLAEAVRIWKKLNCEGRNDDDHYKSCASPIVALISGGASRSGFFAASVLGLLTDVSCEKPDAGGKCQSPRFADRLFAISSVSGGSVGAALYARALADRRVDGGPPCDPGQGSPNYFRADDGSWRRCLQKILADDFLSPVIAGLGFRDVLGFAASAFDPCDWPDRGQRIELAISRSYLFYKDKDHPEANCVSKRKRGLDAPFVSLAPSAAAPRWRPILLLNSTDAQTGKRFVFSGVTPGGDNDEPRWLEAAYDFHQAFPGQDIHIVAAAHDSARFPVISPAGALYNNCTVATPGILDRLESMLQPTPCAKLVDGGYFDNYGAATARDLVQALIDEEGLKPFILLIANDPEVVDAAAFAGKDPTGKPNDLQGAAASWLFPLIAAPVDAVIDTATGRGELAIEEVRRLVAPQKLDDDAQDPSCLARGGGNENPCFAVVAVHSPSVRNDTSAAVIKRRLNGVSMSWWLSKPVQQYLDNQLELPDAGAPLRRQRDLARGGFDKNVIALSRICAVLGDSTFAENCKERVRALAHIP